MKMSFTPPTYIRLQSSKFTESVSEASTATINPQNSRSSSSEVELSETCSQSPSSIAHEFITYFHKLKRIFKNWKKRPCSSMACEAKRRALQEATIQKPIPLNLANMNTSTNTNYHPCPTDSHSFPEISLEKGLYSYYISITSTTICDKGLFLSVIY
jgi:hypothetical protein